VLTFDFQHVNSPLSFECHVLFICLRCTPSELCRTVSVLAGNVRWFHFQHKVTRSRLSFFSLFYYLMAPCLIEKNSATLTVYFLYWHQITLVYENKFKFFLLNHLKVTSSNPYNCWFLRPSFSRKYHFYLKSWYDNCLSGKRM
jgi:hypothetical protein